MQHPRLTAFAVAGFLTLANAPFASAQLSSFAVLGGSTVTNTGSTVVTGDLGVFPGSAVTGFPPGSVVGGTIHSADAAAGQAQNELTVLYTDLAGRPCNTDLTSQDLGGLVLTPGVYCFDTSAQLTGILTLDGQGAAIPVFVFQMGSTLTTASSSSVLLINNASACGVFFQMGSSATLGTGTAFAGSLVALTSITLTTGASVSGRALARNGAVTLDDNDVTVCAGGPALPVGTAIPTLSEWALLLLVGLLAAFGVAAMRRRDRLTS